MTARLPQSDPRLAAISIAAMTTPAVCKEQLHSQALRMRFTQQKVWTPELTDETIQSVAYQDPSKRKIAAVLIPLIQNKDQLSVLLTQRAAHLKDHAGQISFPGGRKEDADQDALATAMREAEEEIGLASSCIEPLGHLPDYFTVTGYQVTPVVALVSLQQQLHQTSHLCCYINQGKVRILSQRVQEDHQQFSRHSSLACSSFLVGPCL